MDSANQSLLVSRRRFLLSTTIVAGAALVPGIVGGADGAPRSGALKLAAAEPWAPHPKTAPQTAKQGTAFHVNANGTRSCSGGWQWRYSGVTPGQTYEISTSVSVQELAHPRDVLQCLAMWGAPPANQERPEAYWDFLLPKSDGPARIRFSRRLVAPENASQLTIRSTLRWTAAGKTVWELPQVTVAAEPLLKRPPVRIAVVTGHMHGRPRKIKSIQDNVDYYAGLCDAACRQRHPQLIVLPEIALQWGLPGSAMETAVPAAGPETEKFAALARTQRVRIALGMFERDGDAVHNSVVLFAPDGKIDGRYHKVHLAAGGEDVSGVLPGDGFPVFSTEVGRLGCNICMDTSAAESSRMVGLNGADFLLMPIMGDHRADRFSRGTPIFSEDRWRAIMRTHAIDNQLCMVVARNNALGSCIVDRKGEMLAWNDGDQDFVVAEVNLDDGYRIWQGGCFRDVNWLQRRPHLYGPFTDPANMGGSR